MENPKIWIENAADGLADTLSGAVLVDDRADADILMHQPADNGFWAVDRVGQVQSRLSSAEFDPNSVDERKAMKFFRAIQKRLVVPFPHIYPLEDFVLVALTDSLEAPDADTPDSIEMIQSTLEMEPERLVLIRIPDDVQYSGDLRKQLFEFDFHEQVIFTRGDLDRLLDACAFVVTQDSPVAVQGLLHRKPAIQFARTDCHHIFRKTYEEKRLKKCFNRMMRDRPEYEKYVYWLFNEHMLDATDKQFAKKFRERLTLLN